MTLAVYPGTFDPFHHGHMDIASRASAIFEELVIAIYKNPGKKPLFTIEERVELTQNILSHLPNVSVVMYSGLTVEFARTIRANVMVRGLRNVADFQFEHQIGWANSHMAPDIDTCCLFCGREYAYLSSTILKEVASLHGKIDQMASNPVVQALHSKFQIETPIEVEDNVVAAGNSNTGSDSTPDDLMPDNLSQRRMERNRNG